MTDVSAATDPVFQVDGSRVPDLARDCLAIAVEETTEGMRTCEAQFLGTAGDAAQRDDVVAYLDGKVLDFGRELRISVGPPDRERVVFSGPISAISVTFDEGDAPHITVNAEDRLMALRQPRRSATYATVSDADVIRRVAARYGLKADVATNGPTYPAVQQVNESDLSFLRGRVARLGAELWITGATLHVATRERRPGEALTLARGAELLSAEVRADLADQRSAVRVSGFDARTRKLLEAEAGAAALARETSGGRTGIDVLESVGRRVEQRTMTVPLTRAEAASIAEASIRRAARRFVAVEGVAAASPQLAVATRLTLLGIGRPFSGSGYYVTRARHVFARDAGGLRTYFSAERPELSTGGAR